MQCVHVRSLEKYHPGYKDRELQWAKIKFDMVQGDPDCEMILDEIDWGRLVKFILLELQAQKPIPLDPDYLKKKNFDLKKRPISLTLQMLHNFLDVIQSPVQEKKVVYLEKIREDKIRGGSVTDIPQPDATAVIVSKKQFFTYVWLEPAQYDKLVTQFGEEDARARILALNNYIGAKGNKYKSHYHTIMMWANKDAKKQ